MKVRNGISKLSIIVVLLRLDLDPTNLRPQIIRNREKHIFRPVARMFDFNFVNRLQIYCQNVCRPISYYA